MNDLKISSDDSSVVTTGGDQAIKIIKIDTRQISDSYDQVQCNHYLNSFKYHI